MTFTRMKPAVGFARRLFATAAKSRPRSAVAIEPRTIQTTPARSPQPKIRGQLSLFMASDFNLKGRMLGLVEQRARAPIGASSGECSLKRKRKLRSGGRKKSENKKSICRANLRNFLSAFIEHIEMGAGDGSVAGQNQDWKQRRLSREPKLFAILGYNLFSTWIHVESSIRFLVCHGR